MPIYSNILIYRYFKNDPSKRKRNIWKGKLPEIIIGLKSGRIDMSIYNNGIAIIDPETLEISFMIEEPCLNIVKIKF